MQRPYHVENTSSRPITEVKQCWAWLVHEGLAGLVWHGYIPADLLNGLPKSLRNHPISFIQDEELDVVERHGTVVNKIQ